MAAKVAADEAFRALMVAMARVPSRDGLRRVRSELAAATALYADRGWLEDPRGYHLAPPPLSSPRVVPASSRAIDFDHLQFVSGYEPHLGEPGRERWLGYKPVRTGHAWVLRHRGAPRPWIVCVHGYRMGFPLADFQAFRADWLHHELGFNVVMPTLPLHGERAIGRFSGDGFFSAQFMDMVHCEAQAIWDLRRILEWLRGQEAPAIGLYGISLGGYTSALLTGFESELDCVIAGMPAMCLADLLIDHAPARLWRLAESIGMQIDELTTVLSVVSPLSFAPAVAREKLHIYGAVADRLIPRNHVSALWEHWAPAQLRWFEGSHLSFTWESAINDLVRTALVDAGMIGTRRLRERGSSTQAA